MRSPYDIFKTRKSHTRTSERVTKTICEDKYNYNTKQKANAWQSKHNKMPSVWQGQNM